MEPNQNQGDEEEDINPFKMFQTEDQLQSDSESKLTMLNRHHFTSIDSTLFIRQLPSQGLSFKLWPAATTLVTLLDRHRSDPSSTPLLPVFAALSSKSPLNVLELGSGTGLLGIAAAVTLGANVTVTDLPHVIPNLKFNADENANAVAVGGGTVDVAALRWGMEGDGDLDAIGKDFDLILGSDVVYHDHLYEPLLYTLRIVMSGEKKVFVMAHLRRWKKDSSFFKKAKKLFDVEVIHVDSPCPGSRIGVVVYLFSQKVPKNCIC